MVFSTIGPNGGVVKQSGASRVRGEMGGVGRSVVFICNGEGADEDELDDIVMLFLGFNLVRLCRPALFGAINIRRWTPIDSS
jgi:hypothetical protein